MDETKTARCAIGGRLRLTVASAATLADLLGEPLSVELALGITTPDVMDAVEAMGGERNVAVYSSAPGGRQGGPYSIEGVTATWRNVRVRAQLPDRPATDAEVAQLTTAAVESRRSITFKEPS